MNHEANPKFLKSIKIWPIYLVLRIQITNENCIPDIEYQVCSFPVKIRIRHCTTCTRSTNGTNPSISSITLAATIASNKTKCPATVASSQQSSCRRPYPTAGTETWRWRSGWGRRRRLVLEMCQGYLLIQSNQQFTHMLRQFHFVTINSKNRKNIIEFPDTNYTK